MPSHYRVIEDKLFVAVLLLFDVKTVRHQWVPVVERVEFRGDAVLILETFLEQQLWVKLELEVIAAQVLHVVFDHNLDGLSYKIRNFDIRRLLYGKYKLKTSNSNIDHSKFEINPLVEINIKYLH